MPKRLMVIQGHPAAQSVRLCHVLADQCIKGAHLAAWAYRWYFGAHSLKSLKRNILKFSGISPVRSSLFKIVENVSQEKRHGRLTEMEEAAKQEVRIKRR